MSNDYYRVHLAVSLRFISHSGSEIVLLLHCIKKTLLISYKVSSSGNYFNLAKVRFTSVRSFTAESVAVVFAILFKAILSVLCVQYKQSV